MSIQRRRGQTALVYKTKVVTDRRGNERKMPDADGPYEVTAAFVPERSSKGEVPGQLIINVVRMIVTADMENIELWSRVDWNGKSWDLAAPPSYHHGTNRHTRHYSLVLRERPNG